MAAEGEFNSDGDREQWKRWSVSFGVMVVWPLLFWVTVDAVNWSYPLVIQKLFPFGGMWFVFYEEFISDLVSYSFYHSANLTVVLISTALWFAVLFFPYPVRSPRWRRGIVALQSLYSMINAVMAFRLL